MFKPRLNQKVEVSTIFEPPQVYITPLAYAKMTHLVRIVDKEVGWLGTAYKNNELNCIIIHDILLFHQEVNSVTCEITPEGLAEFAEELLQEDDGVETWNSIKLWGHSHVNMGVNPSAQDDDQMKVFADHNDWFLRIIANKSGELKIDLFDYTTNVKFTNISWDLFLEEMYNTQSIMEEEIKEKVKEKKAKHVTNYYSNYKKVKTELEDEKEEKKGSEEEKGYIQLYDNDYNTYYDDLASILTITEISEICEAENMYAGIEIIKNILGDEYTQTELDGIYYDCWTLYMDIAYYDC